MADKVPHDVFAALERAEPLLLTRLGPRGVVRVEWVVGFVKPYGVFAWLGTETDAVRDSLPREPFATDVREILESAGLPQDAARFDGTAAQSQETVDRDFQGSWFYSLR